MKKKNAQPVILNSIFNKVLNNLGIEEHLAEQAMMKLWSEAAGSKLAAKTFPHRYIRKEKTMVVGVSTAVLANELQFLKDQLIKKFNELSEKRFNRKLDKIVFELRDKKVYKLG